MAPTFVASRMLVTMMFDLAPLTVVAMSPNALTDVKPMRVMKAMKQSTVRMLPEAGDVASTAC